AGRKLANGRELFALENLALSAVGVGHVLADRDDMRDLIPFEPHGDLAEAVPARLAAGGHLLLRLLDGSGLEHAIEFRTQFGRGLTREHLEHGAADDVVAPEPLGAGLAFPVPALDAVVPVDHVETEWQAVDDEAGEAPMLLDLARLCRHLTREIGRELG